MCFVKWKEFLFCLGSWKKSGLIMLWFRLRSGVRAQLRGADNALVQTQDSQDVSFFESDAHWLWSLEHLRWKKTFSDFVSP